MRPECVVPEVQCAVKRKEKKAQKEKDKPNSTTNGSPEIMKIDTEDRKVFFVSKPSNSVSHPHFNLPYHIFILYCLFNNYNHSGYSGLFLN